MNHDIETYRAWMRAILLVTAIFTTALPVAYSFSAWKATWLGRLFMFLALSFAWAMDVTTVFSFIRPTNIDIKLLFLINTLLIVPIAVSTAALTAWIIRHNYLGK